MADGPGRPTRELTADRVQGGAIWQLQVFESGLSLFVPLRADTELVVGRAGDAHLRLDDPTVSRRHALLTHRGGDLVLRDLGSRNGTRVNGEHLDGPRSLGPGDVIGVGAAILAVQRAPCGAPRALVARTQLERRLEEEIERAVRFRRTLAVAVFQLPDAADVMRAGAELLRRTRPFDVIARDEGPRFILLLPEAAREPLPRVISRLCAALGDGLRAGFASFPEDACDPGGLLERAISALGEAEVGRPAGAAPVVEPIDIGGRIAWCADPAMARLFALLRRLAPSDLPVLLCGETGVGKELAAAALHQWSPRSPRRLVTINCAALPESLVESELFGYEKGAFTGADGAKPGLLEQADGGTVLLDEVGELSPAAQAKLLRVLETGDVARLGALSERRVSFRLVCATNRSLAEEARAGRFRQDLYFRISTAAVQLPPLRERPREIPLLARRFLDEACERRGRPPMDLSSGTVERLCGYEWPGNVRELRNLTSYLASAVVEPCVEPWHLPPAFGGDAEPPSRAQPDAERSAGPGFRNLYDEIRALERARITEALRAAGGIRARAARLIGMPLRTFTTKVREYGLAIETQHGLGARSGDRTE